MNFFLSFGDVAVDIPTWIGESRAMASSVGNLHHNSECEEGKREASESQEELGEW